MSDPPREGLVNLSNRPWATHGEAILVVNKLPHAPVVRLQWIYETLGCVIQRTFAVVDRQMGIELVVVIDVHYAVHRHGTRLSLIRLA